MSLSVSLGILLVICLLLLMIYLQFRWRYRHILAAASKLPCPPTLPVLGNIHLFIFSRDHIGATTNILRSVVRFKGVFCIWLGPFPVFLVKDPADAQIILNSSGTLQKDDVYSMLNAFLGNGLLTAPADIWKKYRKLINPIMYASNVENFLPVFNDVSRKLTDKFATISAPHDPTDDVFDTALDAVARTVVSNNQYTDEIKSNLKETLSAVERIFMTRVFKVWLHIDWVFKLLYKKEINKSYKMYHHLLHVVNKGWEEEDNIRKGISPPDQYNERLAGINLVDVVYENLPVITENHDWRHELCILGAAGIDTMQESLSHLLVILGNYPDVQNKVFMEIQEVMGDFDRDVTVADTHAMKYLNQVILESLRFSSVIPAILRKATKDTKLTGCTLPAGSRIVIMLQTMSYDKEQFPNPKQFLPERFSPEKQKERHNYAFLPFSAGPRNCIGKSYAMLMMKTVLIHILQRLRVTSHTKLSDIKYELKIVMHHKSPLLVSFHPR